MNGVTRKPRLLWFNLATDLNDPVLGFTTAWINALADRSEYIDVITMRTGSVAVADNVRVYSVGKELGYGKPRRLVEFYRVLSRLLAERRYDACFAHMMPLFAILGYPLLRLRRIPITLWYTHKSITSTLRLAEKLVKRIVTASPESFRIKSKKVVVIGHGINTSVFVASRTMPASQVFRIVSIGRIAPAKHLEPLIQSIKILKQDGVKNIRLRLIGSVYPGDVAYSSYLQKLVADNDLDDVVQFVGPIPFGEIVSEYQRSDLMINLSKTGSVDKAVLEAMSCEVPVITSNEAFTSILTKWADLLLLPIADADALANRIQKLMSLSALERKELGRQLRHEVEENHDLSKLVKTLISYFTSDQRLKLVNS